jgi:hypothetical protein
MGIVPGNGTEGISMEVSMNPIIKRIFALKFRIGRRHKVKDEIYVAYEQSLFKSRIDDISMGGLSFYYVDNGTRIDKGSYELAIFGKKRTYLSSVRFKTVSDIDAGELIFKEKKIKRQSVRFVHLSVSQKVQLKDVIRSCTIQ